MEEDIRKSRKHWALLFILVICHSSFAEENRSLEPRKRQIYREGVLPSRGGVIPEGAFTRQRLKHNIHDSLGVEAPDGYLYLLRESDVRPGRRDPEDERDILTLTHNGPQGYTDINGLTPLKPQPTTYLLRRPASGGPLYPSQFQSVHATLPPHRISYTQPHGWHIYPAASHVLFSPIHGHLY